MKLAWKQIFVAFVLGSIVGVVGTWCGAPYYFHRHWGHGQFQARLLQQFSAKLKLAPDQRTKVAAILNAKRQKIDALRAQMRPQFEEIRTSTAAEIRGLLTPEQQKIFDVMNAEFEAKAKQFHEKFHEAPPTQ